MIVFMLLFLAVVLYGCRFRPRSFNADYLSKEKTGSSKGIFAVIIVFSHVMSYVTLSDGWMDSSYKAVLTFLGQSMVSLFFFYSGYGIYEACKRKPDYMDGFIGNRVFRILIHLDVAVLFYWFLCTVILGKKIGFSTLINAMIGLTSLENSNWFVFTMLLLYVFTFVCLKICKGHDGLAFLLITALTVWYIVYARRSGFSGWWYDTALCFSLGLYYSKYKERIESVFMKSNALCYLAIIVSVGLFALSGAAYLVDYDIKIGIFKNTVFALCWVFLSMKLSLDNKILRWLGKHSFSIYVIQRIPMILVKHYGPAEMNLYLYCALSFALVFVCAPLFSMLLDGVDKLLFEKKERVRS